MSSIVKKDLYLAQSVGELNNLAQLKYKITKNDNPKPLLNSANKVFKKAEYYDTVGDEENAYMLYMRYLHIVPEVTKTTKYQQDEKFYSNFVGKKTMAKALDKAEKLSESLTERYKQLQLETMEAVEKERMVKEKEKLANKDMNGKSDLLKDMKDIDDLLNGKKPSTQTSSDVYKQNQVNHSSILSPNGSSSDNKEKLAKDMENKDVNGKSDPLDINYLLSGKKPSTQTSSEVHKKLQISVPSPKEDNWNLDSLSYPELTDLQWTEKSPEPINDL